RSAWLDSLQREKAAFIQVLRTMTAAQVYAIARKALGDIAHADLETSAIEVFLARLRELPEPERKALAASIEETGNEVTVRSFFEIAPELRQKATDSLHRHIAAGIAVNFETAPDLIMGIELKTRGHKISWSLQDYLDELEEKTLRALEKEDRQKPRSQAEKEIPNEGPEKKLRITKESDDKDES
ncbi:MAG: hypothetical protein JW765_00390, partial [Deltaproteobacteria bacterium]|nr:hypothetical protein [Candidatus Zymogenaceae bacterium]